MSAEDLDKLFRDKLKDKPVAPSNDVWERMQARMQQAAQQETPNPFLVPAAAEQKEERGTVRMWYYSAAAAVTMLLGVGLWVNRDIDPLQSSGAVATVQEAKKAPVVTEAPPQASAPAETESETVYNFPAAASQEKEQQQALASAKTQTQAAPAPGKSSEVSKRVAVVKQEETNSSAVTQEPKLMAVAHPVKTQETAKNTTEAPALEIIVKLNNAQATPSLAQASTKETDTPQEEESTGSGRVLKGLLKQVKNLKDGEKVNLSELGYTKHTYALETRIGNKKISKTIEL
ncbi:hypothetical protein [Rufibacter sp. XAAS-G3-1]|uniref:hypothetical protein n=1 Tax=Rufibacter sp. XAAS-G3-1 TaxID=2729134 RepID=UPI0015E630C7|nr:hypothetical protein [Rufibacter sp. XAAS-G3-1]